MGRVLLRTEALRVVVGATALVALLAIDGRALAIQLPSCGDGIVQPAQGEDCDDAGNACCDAATCKFKAALLPCAGETQCARSVCNGQGSCLNLARPDGTICDDGNACTTTDQCLQGFCTGGPPKNCDDDNVCTNDICNPGAPSSDTACVHSPNTNPCDDGLFCNGADVCAGGTCTHAGSPCEGGAECNRVCNEAADNCLDPAGSACGDDGNACTDDTCDGEGKCVHPNNAAPCDDGTFCNGIDVCQNGACIHAGDPCAAGTACGRTCNETAKNCLTPAGAVCPDDGNVCTDDTCDGQGNCIHPNNTADCDDGAFCNGPDVCKEGVCTHAGDPCVLGGPCDRTCNEATDDCHAALDTPCPDDGNVCTDDACDGKGVCAHSNNTKPCDDGQFCNGQDTCKEGSCAVHAGDPCTNGTACDRTCNEGAQNCLSAAGTSCVDDGNPCTDDLCDGQGNCGHAPNAKSCDDGQFCNGSESCQNGTCVHTGDPCAGGAECNNVCNEQTNSCVVPAETPCGDDQNSCTGDFCDGQGKCAHPDAPPTSVTLSVDDAINAADRFCVDLSLLNCGTQVSLLQGTLKAPSADFTLVDGSVTCGTLPAGFSCRASQTSDGIKFVVVPPVTSPPTCIDPTGGKPVVHLCLQDQNPVCSGLSSVPLVLADVQAADCAGLDADPTTKDGAVTCGGALGDCNADGKLDLEDLLAQVDVALQSSPPTASQKMRCDDDCDGDVDIFDMRDQIDAILGNVQPPLTCALPSNTGVATSHVGMRATSLTLTNRDTTVRGVQLTLMPKGGPVRVTGAKATKRTQGFQVVYRQLDPNGPVRVLIVSLTGKKIPKGSGRIAKLALGRGRPRGKLHLVDTRVAR
jgi:hypothetical protein